jgi:hypothetical protein
MTSSAATTNNFASSGFAPLCCIYLPQQLQGGYNNCLIGNTPVATVSSFYGMRNNINFGCSSPCTPDVLVPIGFSNSLAGNLPKAKLGDAIGSKNSVIIGVSTNVLLL